MELLETTTTSALLDGLRNESDRGVWDEFDRRYRPILLGFASRLGLDEHDAADIAQETLIRFVRGYRADEYTREKGRLRSWLVGIAKYRIADTRRAAARRRLARGQSAIESIPSDSELEQIWEEQEQQFIFQRAMSELRETTRLNETTINAFERLVVHHESVQKVAASLNMTPQEIYDAKSRVVSRLRGILEKIRALYCDV